MVVLAQQQFCIEVSAPEELWLAVLHIASSPQVIGQPTESLGSASGKPSPAVQGSGSPAVLSEATNRL